MRKPLNRGDDIEVRFVTHDGAIWHKATIVYVNEDRIKVRYASGFETSVDRANDDAYRLITATDAADPWKGESL